MRISQSEQLNAALQILFPAKKNKSCDCKQLPVVGTNLLDNIHMIHVSVTDILWNLVVQAANMTMQPCQHLWLQTQLTSQEIIHNANYGYIVQTELAWNKPSLLGL